MIDPGSEWFHVRTLAVVTYEKEGYTQRGHEWLSTAHLVGPVGESFAMLEENFRRDYRPNVAVTPELLEGMPGWVMGKDCFGRPMSSFTVERKWVQEDDAVDVTVDLYFHNAKTPQDAGISMGIPERTLPTPPNGWKLRDLVNVLRCLGVTVVLPEVVA